MKLTTFTLFSTIVFLFSFGLKAQNVVVNSSNDVANNSVSSKKINGLILTHDGQPAIGASVFAHDLYETAVVAGFEGKFSLTTSSQSIEINGLQYINTVFLAPFPDTFFIEELNKLPNGCEPVTNGNKYLSRQSYSTKYSKKRRPFKLETEKGKILVHPARLYIENSNSTYDFILFPSKKEAGSGRRKGYIHDTIPVTSTVEGIVMDSLGPLIGASVIERGTINGTITDANGMFSLDLTTDDIVISYFGYQSTVYSTPFTDTFRLDSGILLGITPTLTGPGVVITAEKYRTPHSYTPIQANTIQDIPTASVSDLYNRVPGLYMHSGAFNTNRLTIRGIGSRSPFSTQKLRAFINDIPITNGIGESNLEDINLGIIDKLEIIKGPAAPEYGSALGGTLLYNTSRDLRRKNNVSGQLDYGSFNTYHANINANINGDIAKKDGFITINQDYLRSDGYRDNNAFSRYNLSVLSSINVKGNEISLYGSHVNLAAEIPSSISISDFKEDPSQAAFSWESSNGNERYNQRRIGINHRKEYREKSSSSISAFYARLASDEVRPFNTELKETHSVGLRGVFQYGLNDSGLQLKFGTETYIDNSAIDLQETVGQGSGRTFSENIENRFFQNVFALSRYSIRDLTIEAGVATNGTTYNLTSESPDGSIADFSKIYGPLLLPHFSVQYRPRYDQQYYMNISRGQSAPSLQGSQAPIDFYSADLRREVGINAEIGTRLELNGYEIDASIYSMWVNNLVILEQIESEIFRPVNAGKTYHPGLELSLAKNWYFDYRNKILNLTSSYQYSPHRFTSFVKEQTNVDGNFLPGNPQQKAFLQLQYKARRFAFSINQQYVGRTFANDENDVIIDDYLLTNAQIHFYFKKMQHTLGRSNVSYFFFQVNNIFNNSYTSMVRVNSQGFGENEPRFIYPGLPRNFTLGFVYK